MDIDEIAKMMAQVETAPGEHLAFISHHKGGAGREARVLKDRLVEALKIPEDHIFLDSDQIGWTLNELLEHVRKARVLILIQTAETLMRPFVIGEVAQALIANIPIVGVVVRNGGYDFAKSAQFLSARNFRSILNKETPGCVDVLEKQGIDVTKAGELLKESIPQLISIELDLNASHKRVVVMIEEISEALVNAALKERKKISTLAEAKIKPESEFVIAFRQAKVNGNLKKMGRLAPMERSLLKEFTRFVIDACKNDKDGLQNTDFEINQRLLREAGACEIVVETLQEWGLDDIDLAMEGCTACRCLARNDANIKRLGDCGACELVVKILVRWASDDKNLDLVSEGCMVCGYLARNDANRKTLGDCGACELVVKLLDRWGLEDEKMAANGSLAIGGLVRNFANRNRLENCGARKLLDKLMEKWSYFEDKEVDRSIRFADRVLNPYKADINFVYYVLLIFGIQRDG